MSYIQPLHRLPFVTSFFTRDQDWAELGSPYTANVIVAARRFILLCKRDKCAMTIRPVAFVICVKKAKMSSNLIHRLVALLF